jgi:iron(III) transport system substrate-binding protein
MGRIMRAVALHKVTVLFVIVSVTCLPACRDDLEHQSRSPSPASVVVYTSVDRVISQPVLTEFETRTNIQVKAVYDSEATKTTGLVNRLIAEMDHPQADVFWNSETGRTIILKRKGVLSTYHSPEAADIPSRFKDPQGFWTGFAARCRILIYNTDKLKPDDLPGSVTELAQPNWRGKVSIAYPLFGTTASHMAALSVWLGPDKARAYFEALKRNDILVTDGNASSRERVADGAAWVGFTDTDDALVAIKQGRPVGIIWPDKEGMGTLLIPNTVAQIRGGPNPEAGRRLIDFLLSKKVEQQLAFSDAGQIPLRDNVKRPEHVPALDEIKVMEVDYEKIADQMEPTGRFLHELFVR